MRFSPPSQAHNLQTMRTSPLAELSGSLGDLGTLLPLMIALTVTGSISLSTTLVFTGLSNILTGVFFSVPLPVQPMKAIAAVAIANDFSKAETASAGIFVSAVVVLLSITGLLGWIGRVVPIPVIKGIQVGAGLTLVISAGTTQLSQLGWISKAGSVSPEDNLIWAIAAFLFLLISTAVPGRAGLPRIPYALIVFIVGLVISLVSLALASRSESFFGGWQPKIVPISWADFRTGSLMAGLGQLPLTTLNSIIAVTHLSAELLPAVEAPTPTSLGLSVAAMNLIGCPFGAMPTCHGSGGLAAQYRFGSRSGMSVVALGLLKLVLGLAVSEAWLVETLQAFPKAILGIMVIAAGVELAKVGESLNIGAKDLWERAEDHLGGQMLRAPEEEERKERWLVMTMTVAGLLAFKNDAVGFIAGLLTHAAIALPKWYNAKRRQRQGSLLEAAASHVGLGTRNGDEGQRLLDGED